MGGIGMSQFDGEIPWPLLRRITRQWDDSAELVEVTPLAGGSINTTLLLVLGNGRKSVIKVSVHRINREYEREAHQLNLLRNLGLPTARVLECHTGSLEDPNSYLLLEHIEGVNLAAAKQQCSPEQADALQRHLAETVCVLHQRTAEQYGRILPANAPQYESWPAFYQAIYAPVVKEAEQCPALHVKQKKLIHRIHDKLDRLLAHTDQPRLVHWDLWSSNLLLKPDDKGEWRISAILDPDCKYAHAEAEIAYLDLFHTSAPAFNKAYQQMFKLDDGYHRCRKLIYQLYPLLNHIQLFGNEYVKPLSAALEKAAILV